MTSETILSILTTSGLTGIGGAFLVKVFVKSGIEKAVELNFSKQLEDYKTVLNRELESLKSALKNSEIHFNQQLKALSELRSLYRKFLPKKRSPDMDWDEACIDIADDFPRHEESILTFLCNHDAVLPENVRNLVERAHHLASNGLFEYSWIPSLEAVRPNEDAAKTADFLNDTLTEAIREFQKHVDQRIGEQARS
jgi:hypothetical protein